jgi:hypothetical protein
LLQKVLNDSGYVISETKYCTNGEIMHKALNDSIGRQVMSTVMNFNCDGTPSGFAKTIQGQFGPTKKEVFFHDSLLGTTRYWEYDSLGREVKHENHGFFEQPWSECTTYFGQTDSCVTIKIKENGDTLEKTYVNYNGYGEYARTVYLHDSLVSKTLTSYNRFGHIHNVIHYDNKFEQPISQHYYFYSKPFKLTTEKTVYKGANSTTHWLKYHYTEGGLLEYEKWQDESKSQHSLRIFQYY